MQGFFFAYGEHESVFFVYTPKTKRMRKVIGYFMIMAAVMPIISSCQSSKLGTTQQIDKTIIQKQYGSGGPFLELEFIAGKAHNHPTFAVWLEKPDGEMIQTIFITKSLATGYYQYGDAGDGKWLKVPGKSIRPAALPYWLHKREIGLGPDLMPSPENPVADAFTGATPKGDFTLETSTAMPLPRKFRILAEVNQPWDWNDFWNNNKFANDPDYRTSAQPSLVYAVDVNLDELMSNYSLNPVGHGAASGQDGKLYTNISGHTTALKIFSSISLKIK